MHGITAFSLVDFNMNIKKTKPQNNYLFLFIMCHIKEPYVREHIDREMDRKHQKLSLDNVNDSYQQFLTLP